MHEQTDTQAAPSTAVLDDAHAGDIRGAFGTVREHDASERRSWSARLLTLLAIMGPGLIVMIADNDAGGVSTYAQAGQNYGLTLLWTLPLLIPVLIVNQEMVVRLGAVTGVSLALGYFGVSKYVSVPIAAVLLVVMTATGSFRRWERFMFVFVFANLLLVPLIVESHPSAASFGHGLVVPGVKGGFDSTSVLLVIAIVGTTVAPWQLFFQQSNIVDKRITPRWIGYERFDTVFGSFVAVIGASVIMAVAASAFTGTAYAGHFTDAGGVARALRHTVGPAAGAMFAVVLLNASLIGAATVTLSTSYAFGDAFGARHSLHRSFREAKFFYGMFAVVVVLAAGIVIIPGAPLGVITTGVQALAGVLLPSATVFLLFLCNDREVLGPWVNRPWLNAVAGVVVSVLIMMSLVLMVTTVFPHLDVRTLAAVLGGVLVVAYAVGGVAMVRARSRRPAEAPMPKERRANWRMPPLNLLNRPTWSRGQLVGMYGLRAYLLVAVVLLLVKAIQIG